MQLRPFLGEEPDAPLRMLFASKCLIPPIGEVEDIVNAAEVDAIFGLPENVTALAIVPIGYPDRPFGRITAVADGIGC